MSLVNKSSVTNFAGLALIAAGVYSPWYSHQLLSVGLFAFSGALTNWLAVHMLFERVPGLYGSGVVPNRFEEFRIGIRNLVMQQLFTEENVRRFFAGNLEAESLGTAGLSEDVLSKVEAAVDTDRAYKSLLEVIYESPFAGMLAMIGGEMALEPLRDPFAEKLRAMVREICNSESFKQILDSGALAENLTADVLDKVERIVDQRLQELTPQMVKEIVQEMIRKHLGWLVVWGGVFGGLIGLLTSVFVTSY